MNNPLYAQYETNPTWELQGIFFEAGEIVDVVDGQKVRKPIRFRIARAGGANSAFAKALERESKQHKRAIQTKTLSNEKANEIYLRAFIAGCLLGWENVRDKKGNELTYTFDTALKLLTDLPDLFNDLREAANDAALYREADLEHDLGNSGQSSSTASS